MTEANKSHPVKSIPKRVAKDSRVHPENQTDSGRPERLKIPGTQFTFDPETGVVYVDEKFLKNYLTK